MCGRIRRLTTGRAKVVGNLLHISSCQGRISYTPSIERIVGWTMCKIFPKYLFYKLWSYFDHVMVTWEALPAYTFSRSRVGKPGNETMCMLHSSTVGYTLISVSGWVYWILCVSMRGSWCKHLCWQTRLPVLCVLLCTENALATFCNEL